ncbi:MAG: carbon storage regulator [Candidatus Eremiobacteraeota bacterium]|nr:carbon storage regulator [Candidatus Eremiobacteraeota bacterium]MBV9737543.1 carbon storage regulator [Candidatus Eremiobacteraeota bacterium]
MFVVTRKINEELLIGNAVRIVVLEVSGRQVKLGIDAPDDVRVTRLKSAGASADLPRS